MIAHKFFLNSAELAGKSIQSFVIAGIYLYNRKYFFFFQTNKSFNCVEEKHEQQSAALYVFFVWLFS